MITKEEANRNSEKIPKFKLAYLRWFINRMIKKSSRYGNKSLDISTVNLAGRAYNPRYYIIGKMSKRMLAICLNVIAKELEEENFTVWCLPKCDFPTICANKVMSISWNIQEEKYEVEYYTEMLNDILKKIKRSNLRIVSPEHNQKVVMFKEDLDYVSIEFMDDDI